MPDAGTEVPLEKRRHPVCAWMGLEGLSMRALAREAGMDQANVSRMLTGVRPVSSALRDFCVARYRMPAEVLFYDLPQKSEAA